MSTAPHEVSSSGPAGSSRPASQPASALTYDHGAIVRGPRDRKRLALIFTGGSFGEGAETILDALKARHVKASFFVTGDFLRNKEHQGCLRRMVGEGHYLGPHSDAHRLYCSWEDRGKTLVTQPEFRADLERNLADLARWGPTRQAMRFFIPPFEWYNDEIAAWARNMGIVLFNFTPGTRSNADYLADSDPRFVPSVKIVQSILDYESAKPDGLNGFLLLLHLGSGPARTDKMHRQVARLLEELTRRGYEPVRVDELLGSSGRMP